MTVTISRLYETYGAAERVVQDLESAGLDHKDISIVASNADGWYKDENGHSRPDKGRGHDAGNDRPANAAKGAGIGAAAGGAAGLLTGLGLLAIPGVGPVVAAGWLVTTAAGMAAGGTAGGVIGALTHAGVSKEDAHVYAEGIRRGGTLVTARVPDGDRGRYQAILNQSAIDLTARSAAYRKDGWTGFDEKASPYTPDQVRRDRGNYSSPSR